MQSNNWELRTDNFTLGSAAMASDASVFPGALVSHSTDWRSSYSRCDVYIYIMIGSTLGVLESDENGKECQLPMSNLFPHNQLIPLRDAALPFSQILQEVPRFEVSAMPGFWKGKGLPGVPKWPSEDSLILL